MSKRSIIMPKYGVDLSKHYLIISKGSVVMSKCGVDLSKHCPIMSKDSVVVLTCLNIVLLSLSQTTNFRLFQTGRVCRRQFQI